jgi:hypothetical protein
MPWKRLLRLLAVLAVVTVAVLAAPVLWLAVDEGAVPEAADAPALPPGVSVTRDEVLCGSGGCWRELTLRGTDGQRAVDVAASVGPSDETCRARGLLDRRRVCSGVRVVGNEVRLYLQFDRSLTG